jgi:hypothetical protein
LVLQAFPLKPLKICADQIGAFLAELPLAGGRLWLFAYWSPTTIPISA